MTLITVVIGTYNGEKYIDKCLESLINQSIGIENIEIIIVDDASNDSTVKIIKEYQIKYPNLIKLKLNEINSRISKINNRDRSVYDANGEYIMFLDQDDWYEIDALEILEDYMQKNPSLDYIEYSYYFVSNNIKTVKHVNQIGFKIYLIENELKRNECIKDKVLPGYATVWNKIYKKDYILKNRIEHNSGNKRAGYGDNYFSALLILNTKCMATLDFPLYNYYLHENNYSKMASTIFERCKTGLYFFEEARDRGLLNINSEAVEYMFFQMFLLKTFWKYLLQYSEVQFEELVYIQSKIRELVPEYRKNSLLAYHTEMNVFFDILDNDWDKTYLEKLRGEILKKLEKEEFRKKLYLVTDFKVNK